MRILLDTNVLLRSVHPSHQQHRIAVDAVELLLKRGDELCLVPQVLYEFWAVATRPAAQNGLDFSTRQAQIEQAKLRSLFALIQDTPAIYSEWERLVVQHDVKGKNSHDARLAAAIIVHRIDQLLTFNGPDFSRYSGLALLEPAAIVAGP